jgi:hypothetical protein
MKKNTFSDYLIQQFQDWYKWGDDNWPEAESKWYSELQDDELLEHYISFISQIGVEVIVTDRDIAIKYIHSIM